LIPFEEAERIVLDSAKEMEAETVVLADASNRILARDVSSDIDMPPFDKSAMDGYACRREDLAEELEVVEVIPAGKVPDRDIGPHQCAKIMTGAIVPRGADCVIMVEHTESVLETRIRYLREDTSTNICYRGEDVSAGQVVFRKGERIRAQHIAMLASVGCTEPLVFRRPRVGIIATGNELVEPDRRPEPGEIRNSNSCQLAAQTREAGALPSDYGIARDSEDVLEGMIREGLRDCDLLILSGGVSMGDFDLVPGVLGKNGVKILFEKIAVKPGKPTIFGVSEGGTYCFGLPGNPVSTFVIFELLVKPLLDRLMGNLSRPANVRAVMEGAYRRKKAERESWLPVALSADGRTVKVVDYHGSGHTHALCYADGLISIPVGVSKIDGGAAVSVRLL
jgi:molybdopterin molybdotransferase